jgi:hypothetical protein
VRCWAEETDVADNGQLSRLRAEARAQHAIEEAEAVAAALDTIDRACPQLCGLGGVGGLGGDSEKPSNQADSDSSLLPISTQAGRGGDSEGDEP